MVIAVKKGEANGAVRSSPGRIMMHDIVVLIGLNGID